MTIDSRTRRPFVREEAVAILARTPATLDALLRGLPDAWSVAHEGGETWSPLEIVGHLVHAERTNWLPRARFLLQHGEARPFDEFDRIAPPDALEGHTLGSLLDEFATVRQDSLRELASWHVSDQLLNHRGRHPALGVVTLRQLLSTWVVHDLDHLMQVARVMARQYTDEVGPWRAYLRIVRDAPA